VLVEMARERHVELPICAAVDAILAGRVSVAAAVEALLARPQTSE
jgi:glycerol-3-phosphate dehydrogenase (NAD(P)+)